MKNTAKQCAHGNTGSCPKCSLVKLVAYDHHDNKIVWYSFFKDDRKYKNTDAISVQMGVRLDNKYGKAIKKILFYNNSTQELIAEN